MKKIAIILAIFLISVFSVNLSADEVDINPRVLNEYTFNLDGVDDTFVFSNSYTYFGGVAYVYEDAYMGNLLISEYNGITSGSITSIFGDYTVDFMDESTYNVSRIGENYTNEYTQEQLTEIAFKTMLNKTYITNNPITQLNNKLEVGIIYNEAYVLENFNSYDEFYNYVILSIASMQTLFDNSGIEVEIIPVLSQTQLDLANFSIPTIMQGWTEGENELKSEVYTLNQDFTALLLNYKPAFITNAVANDNVDDMLDSVAFVEGRPPAFTIIHEYLHTIGCAHNMETINLTGIDPTSHVEMTNASGFIFKSKLNTKASIGSIMSYADNRLLWLSNGNILAPAANYDITFGNLIDSSVYTYLKTTPFSFDMQDSMTPIDYTTMYNETYDLYPRIISDSDLLTYYATDVNDNGYSDIIFTNGTTVQLIDSSSTYLPGGTGRYVDKVVLKATSADGYSRYYTRFIANLEETWPTQEDLILLSDSNLQLVDNQYVGDFQMQINPENIGNTEILLMRDYAVYSSNSSESLICTDAFNRDYDMKELNTFSPGEILDCTISIAKDSLTQYDDQAFMVVHSKNNLNGNGISKKLYSISFPLPKGE